MKNLKERLIRLAEAEKELADANDVLIYKAKLYDIHKFDFQQSVEAMLRHFDKLPADLQTAIQEGDTTYFLGHRERQRKAKKVLQQIKELNGLLQQISILPIEIEKLKKEAKSKRSTVEKEWDFFEKNRESITNIYHEIPFPPTPKLLAEPFLDIQVGPVDPLQLSKSLAGKKLRIVNTSLQNNLAE